MSPTDALSQSPPMTASPPKALNGKSGIPTSSLTFAKTALPASPSMSVSAFSLPADKKEEVVTGRERGSFEQTRGNWGNRIVLTTYPGQANVGTILLITCLI
jgi:hypothetical protein